MEKIIIGRAFLTHLVLGLVEAIEFVGTGMRILKKGLMKIWISLWLDKQYLG